MGCAASSEPSTNNGGYKRHTPPPRDPSPPPRQHTPPPREPTPPPREPTPPPREPTPPPREPTPPPREPTPPPREPTPPPREPTPPPREPTPPPREPTPPPREPTPPPREPTPPPREPTPPPREPTPPPIKQIQETDGYTKTEYGIYEASFDFRRNPESLDKDYADPPRNMPFTDEDFPAHVAIQGEHVDWKRPGEFANNPVLFSDGTTRYDIGQGSAGTCWFLSMVAMIADRPKIFHRIMPKDAWNQEGGYCKCYFWRFGEWEEVYVDDCLPIVHGTVQWGAKSRDDPSEMWPALLEKAFARFHGNYNAVYGGQSGDAFLALTGGCSEYINFDKELENDADGSTMNKARALHRRLKNAVSNDSMLTTEVPNEHDGHCGLVGGHAYSLTGATTVTNNQGQEVHLVRVRNPWGHTEWKGAWSDSDSKWGSIDRSQVQHANQDDGEFWISLRDFIKFFSGVTICSMTPDFDKDGCSDSINVCSTIFGEWCGREAAGFQKRVQNPKYIFYVDDEGMDENGYVPLVLQICQKLKHRQKNKASIRVDLYKVVGEENGRQTMSVVELLGEKGTNNVYKTERQMSNRYKVEPGHYVACASTMEEGQEKEFIVRVFSPSTLKDVRKMGPEAIVMETEEFNAPDVGGVENVLRSCECIFGGWQTGHNAGGQVSQPTYHTNPQIEFEIPDRGQEQMINFTLMQETGPERFPIGVQVFQLDDGASVKKDDSHQQYLYQHFEDGPKSTDGNKSVFVIGASASITYVLPPGRYFALLHCDDPSQQTNFALIVRSACTLDLRKHNL